jgi:hypothetical protein
MIGLTEPALQKIQPIRAIKSYPKFWEGKGKGK